jgi:hypothetical protein
MIVRTLKDQVKGLSPAAYDDDDDEEDEDEDSNNIILLSNSIPT